MSTQWLRAIECPLLQHADDSVNVSLLRLVQRLLEIAMMRQSSAEVAQALLPEIAAQVRADHVGVWEAGSSWQLLFEYARPGSRTNVDAITRPLMHEILDKQAGVSQPPAGATPALLGACLSYVERPNRVLLALRPREAFTRADLEYAVAAGHYVGIALEKAKLWDQSIAQNQRSSALIKIGQQLGQQRETLPLLEHIAGETARLLQCERASIFLWDKSRKELIARPALGMPNNELRIQIGRAHV